MTSQPRRRWVLRPTGGTGEFVLPAGAGTGEPVLVLEVTADGQLAVAAPRGPVRFAPADIERVRQVLAEARASTLWQRGRW